MAVAEAGVGSVVESVCAAEAGPVVEVESVAGVGLEAGLGVEAVAGPGVVVVAVSVVAVAGKLDRVE